MLRTDIKQQNNWCKLIEFMRTHSNIYYDHECFTNDFNEAIKGGYCAASMAVACGIVNNLNKYFDEYDFDFEKAFGPYASNHIFNEDSHFNDYINSHINSSSQRDELTQGQVADMLVSFLEENDYLPKNSIHDHAEDLKNIKLIGIRVVWKNGEHDLFPDVESVKTFLTLNPHRKLHKIFEISDVPQTIYKRIETEVVLENYYE